MNYTADLFHAAIKLTAFSKNDVPAAQEIVSKEKRFELGMTHFNLLIDTCQKLGLRAGYSTLYSIIVALENEHVPLTWGHLRGLTVDLLKAMMAELDGTTFLFMPPSLVSYWATPLGGWEDVVKRFPSIQAEIEECSKCLAVNRATASVFHAMRIMEAGIHAVAWKLGTKYAPSWESYIKQINEKIAMKRQKKGVQWKRDERFFAEIAAHLASVRVAWRNPTMHVERSYTIDEARDVYNAVRGFMKHIAKQLSERPPKTRRGASA